MMALNLGDMKGIVALEIGPESVGTFEKQAPVQSWLPFWFSSERSILSLRQNLD